MAGAHVLGVDLQEAAGALASVSDVAGRFHQSEKDGIVTRMMLAKNPAGWVALLDLVATNPAPLVIGINARTADGADPSWLFDVPFSLLSGRTVIATGDRWRDLSVRLRYAEVPHLVDGDLGHALVRAQQEAHGSVDFIGNYTCFQDALKATR
jgi:UDP-N-acetylmuramyl tripeptide synthase